MHVLLAVNIDFQEWPLQKTWILEKNIFIAVQSSINKIRILMYNLKDTAERGESGDLIHELLGWYLACITQEVTLDRYGPFWV